MLRIAYCDDVKKDRDDIIRSLGQIEDKWCEPFDVVPFSSGENLCENLINDYYDVILLDILMSGISGIETATRIRALGKDSLIIFISNYDEKVKELFKFGTIGFLDKPLQTNELEETLLYATNLLRQNNHTYFSFKKNGTMEHIPVRDIMYFENDRNAIILHTIYENVRYYGTIKSIWERLENDIRFIMPHRAFIFNLSFISLGLDKVTVKSTGECINIGKKYSEDTQNRHLKFLEKRCR